MRLGRVIFTGALALVLAAILHLATVLAVPHVSTNDAWDRLAGVLQDEEVALLPPAEPGNEILPLLDPNVVYAACRFDVGTAPFAISAPMPPGYWSIALHTPRGVVFYAVDDEAALDGMLDIELRDAESMRRRQLTQPDEVGGVLAVEAPTREGFALMRALVSRGTRRADIEAVMAETFCGPVEETVVPKSEPEPPKPRFPFPPARPEPSS